jgi:hypothetical protein
MEEQSMQKTDSSDAQHHHDEPAKAEAPEKYPNDGSRGGQKGVGWPVWLLVILIVLLFVSSIANLVVSQRAYESSRKQVKAIEQLTQSIKDIQRSIVDLSKMMEQSPPEDEEPEEESRLPSGDGSI